MSTRIRSNWHPIWIKRISRHTTHWNCSWGLDLIRKASSMVVAGSFHTRDLRVPTPATFLNSAWIASGFNIRVITWTVLLKMFQMGWKGNVFWCVNRSWIESINEWQKYRSGRRSLLCQCYGFWGSCQAFLNVTSCCLGGKYIHVHINTICSPDTNTIPWICPWNQYGLEPSDFCSLLVTIQYYNNNVIRIIFVLHSGFPMFRNIPRAPQSKAETIFLQ